jgi:hypothetical protein
MHEPFLLALTLPLISVSRWQLRNTPRLLKLGRQVCSLWDDLQSNAWPLLCQLCTFTSILDSMLPSMVWDVLRTPSFGLLLSLPAH